MSDLRLTVRLEQAGIALALHYTVVNQTMRDAYLLNRVHDQSLVTTPDLVYLDLDRGRRLIHASKRIPATPEGMRPTMPITPYVSRLAAGATLEETVRIPLPVREFTAYQPVPAGGRIVPYAGLWFTLGYYWSVPGMTERRQQIVPGVEVLVPTPPPDARLEFGEVSSDVVRREIPVLEAEP